MTFKCHQYNFNFEAYSVDDDSQRDLTVEIDSTTRPKALMLVSCYDRGVTFLHFERHEMLPPDGL